MSSDLDQLRKLFLSVTFSDKDEAKLKKQLANTKIREIHGSTIKVQIY